MKKFLMFLCTLILFFLLVGSANALQIVDVINFNSSGADQADAFVQGSNPNTPAWGGEYVNEIENECDYLNFYHYFTFDPAFETIDSASLSIELSDDGCDRREYAWIWDGDSWHGSGEIDDETYTYGVTLSLLEDGDLFAQVDGRKGDFYVNSSTLTIDYTPVAPVPEPATILLMGLGLFGLVGIRRRKNS